MHEGPAGGGGQECAVERIGAEVEAREPAKPAQRAPESRRLAPSRASARRGGGVAEVVVSQLQRCEALCVRQKVDAVAYGVVVENELLQRVAAEQARDGREAIARQVEVPQPRAACAAAAA